MPARGPPAAPPRARGAGFVGRVEAALVETAVLAELRRRGDLRPEEIVAHVRALRGFDARVTPAFVEAAMTRLEDEGRIERREERYVITADGREDAQRIEAAMAHVAAAEIEGIILPGRYLRGPRGADA